MADASENIYLELTADFNAAGRIAVLASGQAVVWYRLAMMSKDGDWIRQETDAACQRYRHDVDRVEHVKTVELVAQPRCGHRQKLCGLREGRVRNGKVRW